MGKNNFLESLKEEALPGIWSRGVQLARNPKSVELIQNGASEKKFKLQTAERLLAFQVTLWPDESDAYCNCGSKTEPCHHIVAVALVFENGLGASTPENEGIRLIYEWEIIEGNPLPRLQLKREISISGTRTPLTGSLMSHISGIQSGRIQAPLPPTTPEDLQIDELLKQSPVQEKNWPRLLKILANLPPILLQGKPISVQAKTSLPVLRVIDHANGLELKLETPSLTKEERFQENLRITNQVLSQAAPPIRLNKTYILAEAIAEFTIKELPLLKEHFEVVIESTQVPTVIDGIPVLDFKIHQVSNGQLAITPTIRYESDEFDPAQNQVIRKNAALEQSLHKKIRQDYQMAFEQTTFLDAKAAFEFKQNHSLTYLELDQFLTQTLGELRNISSQVFQENRDEILHLLELKQAGNLQGSAKILSHQFLPNPSAIVSDSETHSSETYEGLPSLWSILRAYQKAGVKWLQKHQQEGSGCILADDMGLGKTIQTLAILKKRSLIVVPTSLIQNWKDEVTRFRPDLKWCLYHGINRKWDEDADLVLTTYGVFRSESDRFSETWSCAVLDEAHLIRNQFTQAAIASFQINSRFKVALTGTPIQNRARDLWSLFQFIAPGVFQSEANLKAELIEPFLLRRTKDKVLTELPPKTYLRHQIELSDAERKSYQSVWASAKKEVVAKLDAGERLNPLTLFEVLLRVRQACDHRGLYDFAHWNEPSSKLTALIELVSELLETGQSVLVYSQWTKFLDRIQFELRSENLPYVRLDGSTKDRGGVVNQFQTSERAQVFLLSLHAGGVGLNLTRATHVIFCDPWWNPFVELQAEDRAYRMGQAKPVTIHRLTIAKSIEEKIAELQEEKKKRGEELLAVSDLTQLIEAEDSEHK